MPKLIKKYKNSGLLSWDKPPQDATKIPLDFNNKLKFGMEDSSADFMKKQKVLQEDMDMKSLRAGIIPSSKMSLSGGIGPSPSPSSSGGKTAGAGAGAAFGGVGLELLGQAPQILDVGIQAFGGKKAETATGGEEFTMGLMDTAASGLLKSGNPYAMAAGAGLMGLTALNKYAGTTAKKQGTAGMDTGGYAFNMNPNAGKKQTLLGTWGGKTKRANTLTASTDRSNLLAGNAAYKNTQNLQAANNSFGDIQTTNQQKLAGGLNTNILAAKKGAKINPTYLRNIVNKVKHTDKINKEVIEEYIEEDITKFQDGGKMNVIPDGALHARKNNYDGELGKTVTDKGIPVITYDDGGEITQHAEIEINEIIFHKDTTTQLEDFFKQYKDTESKEEKNKIALECGKFLSSEILENTDDKTGLLNTIE